MKKILSLILLVFVVLSIYFMVANKFTIVDDEKQIKQGIESFANRGKETFVDIDIKKIINLRDRKFVLFMLENQIGSANLIKGFNGKYKVEDIGYGTNNLRKYIYEIDKKKYVVIFYKNIDLRVKEIEFIIQDKKYETKANEDIFSIVYLPIDTTIKAGSRAGQVMLLDNYKNDITYEILEADLTIR